jgi:hypothetical protein
MPRASEERTRMPDILEKNASLKMVDKKGNRIVYLHKLRRDAACSFSLLQEIPGAASLFNLFYNNLVDFLSFFRLLANNGRQMTHSMRVANCDVTDNKSVNKTNEERKLCGSDYIREFLPPSLSLSLSFSLSLPVFLLAIKKHGCWIFLNARGY